jgi:hypothetical protein
MKSKKRLSMEHNGKTILDYFKVVNRSSNNNDSQYLPDVKQQTNQMKSPSDKRKRRSATYFDGCITIDDDDDDDNTKISTEDNDIQEIQRKRYIYGVFLVVESLLSRLDFNLSSSFERNRGCQIVEGSIQMQILMNSNLKRVRVV